MPTNVTDAILARHSQSVGDPSGDLELEQLAPEALQPLASLTPRLRHARY